MAKYITHTALRNIGDQALTKAGIHQFISDNLPTNHGTDAGPNPTQYLMGALGSCLSISAKALAGARNIEIKSFNVDIEASVERFPDKSSRINEINVKITCRTNLVPNKQLDFVNEVIHISTIYNTLKAANDAMALNIEIMD
ncbi:OsmC family protein [Lentilactobacillus laojiaonis]|uniref:OsmC family protein n=1 Tax=Lentilactobacillus laojiaonis TaxID=2883998 RepID=UPI001D09C515|nr:OsmC family protein [Lentilactobacillus laojiaonis]UDM32253.1 OsmC family protein [Lentilactobacillus laojiaonis]